MAEVSCVICRPFRWPVSWLALGFLSCCFPGERMRLTEQRKPLRRECTVTLRRYGTSRLGATALPTLPLRSPPSALRRRARPFRPAGFRFNNAQSCLLPDRPP
ncbi:unnamed protein product [Pipistrellus nathusii]|uniref:Secreted protein n=1 Tax=Pipistrellus nathusii TaxID=59473 RepID=A0ABP0ADU7_PIPNA